MVLKMDPVRIGCRVRRPVSADGYECFKLHSDEFTIRAGRPSGVKTELTKVIEGWGDYFFYAFADYDHKYLMKWSLCNLKVFRVWFNRQIIANKGKLPGDKIPNRDGSSFFMAYVFSDLPDDFVIANNCEEEIKAEVAF